MARFLFFQRAKESFFVSRSERRIASAAIANDLDRD
jgi:hypothetical protein